MCPRPLSRRGSDQTEPLRTYRGHRTTVVVSEQLSLPRFAEATLRDVLASEVRFDRQTTCTRFSDIALFSSGEGNHLRSKKIYIACAPVILVALAVFLHTFSPITFADAETLHEPIPAPHRQRT